MRLQLSACLSLILFLFCSPLVMAQTTDAPSSQQIETEAQPDTLDQATEEVKKVADKASNMMAATRARRADNSYFVLGNYSGLDLILPNKYGASVGLIRSADVSWELEYLHSSVSVPFVVKDLGEMTDDRISIIRRSYLGSNSFNISYGLSYFDFSLHIGDDLLSRLTNNQYPSVDIVRLQSFGLNVGLGNRWTFKHNITFGIDWISLAQPIFVTKKDAEFLKQSKNQNDKDDVDKAVNLISYFPRFSLLKLQLGILF